MQNVRISAELLEQCFAHGRQTYPEEACGVLSGPAADPQAITQVHPIANLINEMHAKDSQRFPRTGRDGYFLDPRVYMKLERALAAESRSIRAIYHTHVDVGAYFSQEDRTQATWNDAPLFPGLFYLVCGVKDGEPDGALVAYFDDARREFAEYRLDEQGRRA